MAVINIYILASHRCEAIEVQCHFFKKIRNKDKIKVYMLATTHGAEPIVLPVYYEQQKVLQDAGIECEIVPFAGGLNYMDKIHYAQKQDCEYAVKLDEDIYCNEHVWDFMIENRSLLNDPDNLVLSPILSNGIPTCDYFVQDFMNPSERKEVEDIFLKTNIGGYWGVDYTSLNAATTGAQSWDPERFYALVSKINHFYKGIHPVRINFDAAKKINDIILANWDKFQSVPYSALYLEKSTRPYMCNSVFMIKAETWRTIVADISLYVDPFDEVPVNRYRENHNSKWLFVRNGFGIHMLYNTVGNGPYETGFMRQCIAFIRNSK